MAKTVKRRKKADIPEREKAKPLPTREPDRVAKVERAGLIPFDEGKAEEVARELVESTLELKRIKAEMEEEKKKQKEKMDSIKSDLSDAEDNCIRLAERHDKGGFEGTVQCERRMYFEEELVVDVNVETGEVEEAREMEAHEKQLTLVHSDKDDASVPPSKPHTPE